VLVVDDEASHLRACERALSGVAPVRTARGGAEADERLRDGRVALMVSDQRMPGECGIDLLSRVRRGAPEMLLVLLTAYADQSVLERAINGVGLYHLIEKPWTVRELRQVVARGLDRHRLERERQALIDDLRRARLLAEREAEYKSHLLSRLAHELGTPAHIAFNAVGLLGELELAPEAGRWLGPLRRASDWLVRGVAQIQRASQVSTAQLSLECAPMELAGLAGSAATDLRRALGGRQLEVVERTTEERIVARGDRDWLRQAVWNLLTNAARCTPDGGRITVGAERRGDRGRVFVEDTGVGIDLKKLDGVFACFAGACGDPVLHGSGWLEFGAKGLGLGLFLTRRIAEAHDGRLIAARRQGGGSRFAIDLPAAA